MIKLLKIILVLVTGTTFFFFQNCSYPELVLPPEPQKTISLKLNNYCPQGAFVFQEIFVYNSSAQINKDHFIPDFDRDGLSDEFELNVDTRENYRIHVGSPDANGDNYSDLINISLGLDRDNQFRLSFCESGLNDTDLDGLTDCEENVLSTNYLDPDSDQDGIPDGLEVRNGLNPTDPTDSRLDIDQDNLSNLDEIKKNTPLKNTNDLYIDKISLKYNVETYLDENSLPCYTINIDNVPIMPVTNGNAIRIYLMESRLEVGGTESQEIRELQQINVIVDRLVIHEAIIPIKKNNLTRTQLEIINLDEP
ncbi:MAG: hypothetical protein HOO06_05390 [Bdellovibrionaceae bacterium]|jgi:hypothetical protein|nr:hypothetical protein [Pseudobdellovibrionaceae bacterium]